MKKLLLENWEIITLSWLGFILLFGYFNYRFWEMVGKDEE